jgi:hypothetical protein
MNHQTPAAQLIQAVTLLAQARSIEKVAEIVKFSARALASADGTTFILRENDQCRYLDEDAISPLWKGRHFDIDTCISGWSMNYRQQVIIADIEQDGRIPQEAYRPTFVKSLVMTPVRGLHPVAAIGVYWKRFHKCSPEEASWLQALADSTAVTLERLESDAELQRLRARLDIDATTPLTVCAWTKRVKYEGEWMSIEAFLLRRFGIVVSHGISEEAQKALLEALPVKEPGPDTLTG